MTDSRKISEGVLLALLPLLGIAIVAVHQIGKYLYFGVPLEFLEIDTVKVILSGLSLALYGTAGIYSLTLLYNNESIPNGPRRVIHHLFIAAFVSFPVLVGRNNGDELSWAAIGSVLFFIVFFAIVTLSAEHHLKRLKDSGATLSKLQIVESYSGLIFWVSLLVLIATVVLGTITAKDQKRRIFISGTNQFVVAKSGDVLIAKEYDPPRQSFNRDNTILVPIDKVTTLTERDAPIR